MSNKTITIDTLCSVADVENFLQIISHEGHWHDATVKVINGKLVILFNDDQLP